MQIEIKERTPLLDSKGHLIQPGYAKQPYFQYQRNAIKAPSWRIKEWDYYAVLNHQVGCSLTIADLSYSALLSIVFFDFQNKKLWKKTKLLWFTFGKLGLPSTSLEGDVGYEDQEISIRFVRRKDERVLTAWVKDFLPGKDLSCEFQVQDMKDESLVIATPWNKKPKAFYYNQKINCMPTKGSVHIGQEDFVFDPKESVTVLDWGRGVWTYKNTWYWSNAQGYVNGKRFGFNFGYGFGNTQNATENMLFYDGKAHKLEDVFFDYDPGDYLKPWTFSSPDGRVQLTMTPILDRQDDINFIIIKNLGHQVFGTISGTVILDDHTELQVNQIMGFAEVITNHY